MTAEVKAREVIDKKLEQSGSAGITQIKFNGIIWFAKKSDFSVLTSKPL